MSGWPRIYYKLLNLPLSILVKSKSIPADPAPELGLDTSRPIMYVLPYNSKADLLTLRAQCLAHDLPDPLEPLEIDGTLLPRYVFIHGGPRVFTYYTPKEESIKLFHDYLDLHRSNPNLDVQMVPVSVMFGRAPGREKGEVNPPLRMLNGVQKFFAVLWLGRDSFAVQPWLFRRVLRGRRSFPYGAFAGSENWYAVDDHSGDAAWRHASDYADSDLYRL